MVTYKYKAKVVRWVDGDTVWLNVDLGFRTFEETDFRLYGVDTPERGKPGYQEAIDFVNANCPVGQTFEIATYKDPDKYGRWLVMINLPDGSVLNTKLVAEGYAVAYYGGTRN